MGNLKALTSLDLSGNQLSGSIPAQLGRLTALTDLTLANNDFTGCVPAALMRPELRSDIASLGLTACDE